MLSRDECLIEGWVQALCYRKRHSDSNPEIGMGPTLRSLLQAMTHKYLTAAEFESYLTVLEFEQVLRIAEQRLNERRPAHLPRVS